MNLNETKEEGTTNAVDKSRVLIVEEDSLFTNVVELLLILQENLVIVGTVSPDIQAITTALEQTQPDVIIISDDIATANVQLILPLLKIHPHLRIITFNLDDNRLNVYDNREVDVTTVNDLVSAITDLPNKP